jgi:SprB repeat
LLVLAFLQVLAVEIRDANNCQLVENFNITQPTAITAMQSQNNVACFGESVGSATVFSVQGGSTFFGTSYLWSNGSTSPSITGLLAGTYTCDVTDNDGCTITKTFNIMQPDQIVAAAAQTNVSCNGNLDGSIILVATGGVGPLTFSWSPTVSFNDTATMLAAGSYTCAISDTYGCSTTQSFTITQTFDN